MIKAEENLIMHEKVRRGFVASDEIEFSGSRLIMLKEAQKDIVYLINCGYSLKRSVELSGDKYQFSLRQRMALTRASCCDTKLGSRKMRECGFGFAGKTLTIDAFNVIITLETALSKSTVILCMDGTLRDLCGLRGTYRLIDKTDAAIRIIAGELAKLQIGRAVFILDRPVSNSGRLRKRILEMTKGYPFTAEAVLTDKADYAVACGECAVTSDSAVLDRCGAWVNLARLALDNSVVDFVPIDLSQGAL